MNGGDAVAEESLIASISRYANSQNAVRQSDLSANKPFHVDVERLAMTVYCPDGVGRWFYERAAGSYNTLLAREATPARRKALKDSMPSSRKITKTDLAKYLMAWDGRADIVSLGTQKCFDRFMTELAEEEAAGRYQAPDTNFFKELVAKALIFKAVHKTSRPRVTAFLANVTAYTVSVLARSYGSNLDLDRIWQKQGVSSQLMNQIAIWASEVDQRLKETSGGRMISEWAKRAECREKVLEKPFSSPSIEVPEYRKG